MRKDFSAKYLRITMHDNDFRFSLKLMAESLYQIFKFTRYPKEEELPLLKKYIQHMWFATNSIEDILWYENSDKFLETKLEYFVPHLEFLDYVDIPDDDNCESAYIPMFDGAEVLLR